MLHCSTEQLPSIVYDTMLPQATYTSEFCFHTARLKSSVSCRMDRAVAQMQHACCNVALCMVILFYHTGHSLLILLHEVRS